MGEIWKSMHIACQSNAHHAIFLTVACGIEVSFFQVHGWFCLGSLVWYTMAVKRVLWISLKPLMGGLVFSPFHWLGVGGVRIEQCKKQCMEFRILPCAHTFLLLDAMPCRASFLSTLKDKRAFT
jgi:hypothetical protein